MKIENTLTDETILAELGSRITQRRVELRLTQISLAEKAGVAKRTVERIEAGATAQMSTMIRIFRVLDLLPGIDGLMPEAGLRPMEMLKPKKAVRKRASSAQKKFIGTPWHWGDKA